MGISLLDAALAYAARGWHVFPLQPQGKAPLGALVRTGKDEATTDPDLIRRWWQQAPEANIGIALAPSRLLVLDVDVSGDKQGKASLASIIEHLPPSTLTQRTARGGVHAVYQAPLDVAPTNRLGFLPGLDLIGVGYIVAAPSTFEGKPYAWKDLAAEPAACPPHLAGLARERPPTKAAKPTGPTTAAAIGEGGRNASLFRLAAALRDTGLGEQAIGLALLSTNAEQCNPPLGDDEVLGIAAKAMRHVTPTRNVLAGQAFMSALGWDAPTPQELPQEPLSPDQPADGAPRLYDVARRVKPPIRQYPTKFPVLDVLIGGGWLSRTLHVLLGPPGAGKTAFMVGVSLHHAIDGQRPVLYGCTELESDEIAARHAAPLLGVPWTVLERGRATIDGVVLEGQALQERIALALKEHRIHVFGSEVLLADTQAVAQLGLEALRLTRLYGEPPLVIVDYMQDLSRGAGDNIRSKVGELATHFRGLAQRCDCPLLVVSSVSRAHYGTAKAETMRNSDDASIYLSAAKESGDVDYAAATVIFLDVETDNGSATRAARLAVAKARRGRTGFAGARFEGASGRWTDDPGALAVMSPEAQKDRKVEVKVNEMDDRVFAFMQRAGIAMSKATIESGVTGKGVEIRASVDRLLATGRIGQLGAKFIAKG